MDSKPSKWYNKSYSLWLFLSNCDTAASLIMALSSIATTFNVIFGEIKSTLFYLSASLLIFSFAVSRLMKKPLFQRAQNSRENLTSMAPGHSFESLFKGPPINSIRFEQCAETYIAFANAMNDLASNSDTFSEDDLELISHLVFNDKVLRKSLKRYKTMEPSLFATLLFLLDEKGDFTRGQWAQMCKVLLKFMGEEPKSKQVRNELCLD
tara:strand:- start:576 stop:1202 length:627 start_codon:yes stop_codon:yes gene_type:complete